MSESSDEANTAEERSRRRQPVGQAAGTQSVTDIFSDPDGKRALTYIIGIFSAVGIGYGVGLVLLDVIEGQIGLVLGIFAFVIPVFGAPLISMITGTIIGLQFNGDQQSLMLLSGVGAFVGYFALLVILLVFTSIVGGGGGGGTSSGGNIISELFAHSSRLALVLG
jgi:hypothetical protein